MIVKGWRDNGNAHGYHIFMVLMHNDMPIGMAGEWDVVAFEPQDKKPRPPDFITDAPHTFEDYVRSVRFVWAKLNGTPATLLITATRQEEWGKGLPEPFVVSFEIYRLEKTERNPGSTPYAFISMKRWTTSRRYCNSDKAMSQELGLPLPKDYLGADTPSGCDEKS